LVAGSLAAPVEVARAQQPASNAADVERARELFREGVALMAAEDYAGALAKFKEVGRVRMTAQVAFNIAECEEKLGKLVAALGNYRLALAKAQEPDANAPAVANHAPERIAALEKRVAKLTIVRKEPKPNPTATIELDGVEVASAQVGTAIRTDPGERTLRVLGGGKVLATKKIALADGEAKTVEIEVPAPEEAPTVGPGPDASSGVSVPGVVLTALGGGMLVAGGVFIGLRQAAISDLDEQCGGDSTCPPSAEETYDRGRLYTGLAEGFIPAGAAAATVGIILIVLEANAASDEKAEQGRVRFWAPAADVGAGLSATF
jgi:tetratricopeptide (TPR) repeat protein